MFRFQFCPHQTNTRSAYFWQPIIVSTFYIYIYINVYKCIHTHKKMSFICIFICTIHLYTRIYRLQTDRSFGNCECVRSKARKKGGRTVQDNLKNDCHFQCTTELMRNRICLHFVCALTKEKRRKEESNYWFGTSIQTSCCLSLLMSLVLIVLPLDWLLLHFWLCL